MSRDNPSDLTEKKALPLESRPPRPWEQLSDDDLMQLAQNDESAAFDILVRRHQAMVLRVAVKYLGNPAQAADVAQAAFIDLWRALSQYSCQGKLKPFLLKIVINHCKMASRSWFRFQRARSRLYVQPRELRALPEEHLLAREHVAAVEHAVRRLSKKLRDVILLRFAADLSYEEIASALDVPVGTVKSRCSSGLEQLRRMMKGRVR